MNEMLGNFQLIDLLNTINSYLWSLPFTVVFVGAALYFSVASRFMQLRYLKHMFELIFHSNPKDVGKRGISSFQALVVSVSGRVGTGNIAGVATAIAFGGPGALFWMWVIAILGASTSFVECALAQMYKIVDDGEFRGGPAFYIDRGLKWKWFAVVFAIGFFINMAITAPGIQANTIAASFQNAFGIEPVFTIIPIVLLIAFVIFGGIKRISHVAEFLVPMMAVGYVLMALFIIFCNYENVPAVFAMIFKSAFGLDATMGGIVGTTIAWGVKRGLYSNEAGQGSAPHVAAVASVRHPVEQGLIQSLSVFIDTLFVCTATGLMILLTGNYNLHKASGGYYLQNIGLVEPGPTYTQLSVDTVIPGFGSSFVAVALLLFAFTTILNYYYVAETNLAYLLQKTDHHIFNNGLRILMLVTVFYGGMNPPKLAWAFCDLGMGLAAWLNVIAILLLAKPGMAILKDYEEQLKLGKEPTFDPAKFGISDEYEIWKP